MDKKEIEDNVIPAVKILVKKYNAIDKTTLNRMRTKPDPYKILISCLLSLRAKDETTEKISKELYKTVNTPQDMLKMPTEQLEKIIFSTGHYRKKAQVLKSVSKDLIERFNSKVPNTREELLSIKGIGPKTANIVLAFAFNQPVIPVDTHVHRIPNRLGWVKTKNPEQTEIELMKILPKEYWQDFNAVFVQFGRDICQPVSPWCSKCPINKYCKRIGIEKSR
jgi:endonuclease-3